MRSLLLCLATTFLLLIMAMPGAQVSAQSLFSLPASEADDDTDALADTLRLAAENGLSVVVVDTQGNIIVGGAEDAQEERAQPRESALMMAQAQGTAFRGMLRQRLQALPDSLNEVAYILRATSPDGRIMTFVEVLLYSALLFGVGRLVMVYFVGPKIFQNFVTSRIKEKPAGYREKMPFLVFRFFVGIFATLISMAIAYVLGALIFPPVENQAIQVTILAIYVAFFAIRTIGDVWRMMLSPFLAQYRIPNLSDRDALVLYRWVFYVAALDVGVVTFATWIKDFGLNYNVYAIGYGGLALIMAALNICVALFNRRAISNAIRNGRAAQDVALLTRLIARFWAPVVIIYVVFGWFELAFDLVLEQPLSIPLVAGAYAVFMTILIVYGVINFGIETYFQRARRIQDMNAILESDDDESDMTAAEVEAMDSRICRATR